MAECNYRCYEIKCATGVVIGNYSSSAAAIPFNTSVGFHPAVDLNTVRDDYNRSWPGNSLTDQDELFTRCWNVSQVSLSCTSLMPHDLWPHGRLCAAAARFLPFILCVVHPVVLLGNAVLAVLWM